MPFSGCIAYNLLRACASSQLLKYNHKMELTMFEIRVLLKHYWKQDYKTAAAAQEYVKCKEKVLLVSMWHKDGSIVSTLEKKILKISTFWNT